jgi:uncharacterized protein
VDFEWDPDKAASNLAKHSVDFYAAAEVFADPARLVRPDTSHSDDEQRFQTIGAVRGVVLFVVYTMRGDTYRIISARKASRDERKAYSLQA